ncbi:MAG: SGNH/GDSL hydrolase family protein [Planctomycetota bacterium]|nr:hypothetical protein [Planctomycetota bacterium]
MAAPGVTPPAGPRLVLLGASNLSRGLPRLVAEARGRAGTGVDCFVAAGHGRSYGATSRVGWRRLPSILGCGLWRALDRLPADGRAPLALVTDVGNDLLYGFAPDQVAAWVATAVGRLQALGGRVVVTHLPMASIAGIGPLRFRGLRACYVPGCRLTLPEVKAAAAALDERLAALAREVGVTILEAPGEWYGFDAIHVRRRRLDELWHRVHAAWGIAEPERRRRATVGEWMRIGSAAAEVRVLAGRLRLRPQPALALADGSRVWLY